MDVGYWANVVTLVGFPLAAGSVLLVFRQLYRDGLAASASAVYASYASMLASINSLPDLDDPDRDSQVNDLFNELELACALWFDGQFKGRSGKLILTFLQDIFAMIEEDEGMKLVFERAIHSVDTFENIRDFAQKYKNEWSNRLSITRIASPA